MSSEVHEPFLLVLQEAVQIYALRASSCSFVQAVSVISNDDGRNAVLFLELSRGYSGHTFVRIHKVDKQEIISAVSFIHLMTRLIEYFILKALSLCIACHELICILFHLRAVFRQEELERERGRLHPSGSVYMRHQHKGNILASYVSRFQTCLFDQYLESFASRSIYRPQSVFDKHSILGNERNDITYRAECYQIQHLSQNALRQPRRICDSLRQLERYSASCQIAERVS